MRLFLKNIIIFLIPLFVINMCFYAIVYSLYFKEYESVDLNYKTYLLADSRGTPLQKQDTTYGFYNFSAPSDSYEDMSLKLKYLIKHSSIETLIITIDDHTLSKYRETKNNKDRSVYFMVNENFNDSYKLFKDKYINRYFPLLSPKGRDVVESFLWKKKKKKKYQKWASIPEKTRIEKCKIRIAYQFKEKEKSQKLSSYLLEIIELCRVNEIKVYGIKLPLSKEYIKEQSNNSYEADMIFTERGIKILDFKNQFLLNDKYFFNEDHLNQEGGSILTKIMLNKLN